MQDPASTQTLAFLRQNEIGKRARIPTPFGPRLIFYADLTATGRYLHFVEAWMRHILPFYANTHTAVSSTGSLLTGLREQSRGIVHAAVHAGPEHEVVFCGSGATAAVNKLVGLLGFAIPEPLERRYQLSDQIPANERPVVFVGPYEHHSNYLPWLESIADVIEIPDDDHGQVDLAELRRQLDLHAERSQRIGAFSAASNVTGLLADVEGITRTLRRGGARVCFDYAAGAPYLPIDLHAGDPELEIDAIFLSPHKFLGGAGGSGVLVAHRDLFVSRRPERPGGGTVDYVGAVSHAAVDYVRKLDEREEAGTPAILSDLRAGAAFLVQEMVGAEVIREHELELSRQALARLGAHPRIQILGPTDAPRLGILSIQIEPLHHDLASALLDHLFGIQNRAGCACAGPYGHRLLGIGHERSEGYRALVQRGLNGMKPGWIRLSLPYYASQEDIEYLLCAVEFVAEYGEQLIPAYRFNWSDGVWRVIDPQHAVRAPLELTVESLRSAAQTFGAGDHETPLSERDIRDERERYFVEARALVKKLGELQPVADCEWNRPTGDADVDPLVWFRYVHTDALAR